MGLLFGLLGHGIVGNCFVCSFFEVGARTWNLLIFTTTLDHRPPSMGWSKVLDETAFLRPDGPTIRSRYCSTSSGSGSRLRTPGDSCRRFRISPAGSASTRKTGLYES